MLDSDGGSRLKVWEARGVGLTFGVLHDDGGVLEEGDEQVAGLQVGVQRQLRVVHRCTAHTDMTSVQAIQAINHHDFRTARGHCYAQSKWLIAFIKWLL